MSQQSFLIAKEVNSVLDYIKKNVVSSSGEAILLFYSALVRLHLEYRVQSLTP